MKNNNFNCRFTVVLLVETAFLSPASELVKKILALTSEIMERDWKTPC